MPALTYMLTACVTADRFAPLHSFQSYAYRLLVTGEFSGRYFDACPYGDARQPACLQYQGDFVLSSLGIAKDDYKEPWWVGGQGGREGWEETGRCSAGHNLYVRMRCLDLGMASLANGPGVGDVSGWYCGRCSLPTTCWRCSACTPSSSRPPPWPGS